MDRHCKALLATLVLLALVAPGCAHRRTANPPLDRIDLERGYRPKHLMKAGSTGDIAFALAMSGGGTRAAALSYGVLLELRDTVVTLDGKRLRLLDEVDSISSVSGGSFTAAYYGLYGDRIFEDFEERFLKRDVQGGLLWRIFIPWNLLRLAMPFYDRSELAIKYYDDHIFDGATFADLEQADGPLIQINATDLTAGSKFTFLQQQFDVLCSDLSQLQVSRAVTASSAVPVVFNPIALRNYAGSCDFQEPAWVEEALKVRKTNPRRYHLAAEKLIYLDPDQSRYLHLVDGGIADNLGVRGPLDNVVQSGGMWRRFGELEMKRPRSIVFIMIDSSTNPNRSFVQVAGAPSLSAMLNSITDTQLHRYNFETKALLHEQMDRWAEDMSAHGIPISSHLIDLAEYAIDDPAEREFFDGVPTALTLEEETVDRLIALGRQLLRESEEFQALLAELGAE